MNYGEEMNEKIMNATDEEMRKIINEIEFVVFDGLTPPAKTRFLEVRNMPEEEI